MRALGLVCVVVPVGKDGKSLSFASHPPTGLYYSSNIIISLPEGYSANDEGICFGGVRNSTCWPTSFSFNGRQLRLDVWSAVTTQPWQITAVFSCNIP